VWSVSATNARKEHQGAKDREARRCNDTTRPRADEADECCYIK